MFARPSPWAKSTPHVLSFLCNSRESVTVGEGEGAASLLGNRYTLNFPHILENSTGATQEDAGVPYRIHRAACIVFSVDGHLSWVNAIAVPGSHVRLVCQDRMCS